MTPRREVSERTAKRIILEWLFVIHGTVSKPAYVETKINGYHLHCVYCRKSLNLVVRQ